MRPVQAGGLVFALLSSPLLHDAAQPIMHLSLRKRAIATYPAFVIAHAMNRLRYSSKQPIILSETAGARVTRIAGSTALFAYGLRFF